MKKVIGIGLTNFRRECDRMYEHSAISMKFEEKSDLLQERRDIKQSITHTKSRSRI